VQRGEADAALAEFGDHAVATRRCFEDFAGALLNGWLRSGVLRSIYLLILVSAPAFTPGVKAISGLL
jgi:hypothetical protein